MEEYKPPDSDCQDKENAVELEEATFIWNQADPMEVTPKKKKKKGTLLNCFGNYGLNLKSSKDFFFLRFIGKKTVEEGC